MMTFPLSYLYAQDELKAIKKTFLSLPHHYEKCYISGVSMALLALENIHADTYLIQDQYYLLQVIRDNPRAFLKNYKKLLNECFNQLGEPEEKKFFLNAEIFSTFQTEAKASKTAALYFFLLNYSDVSLETYFNHFFDFSSRSLLKKSEGYFLEENLEKTIDRLHVLLNRKKIIFENFLSERIQKKMTSKDFLLIDNFFVGQHQSIEEKESFQLLINRLMSSLSEKGSSFFIFHGSINVSNTFSLSWRNYALHESGQPGKPFGKYIENVYFSDDIGPFLESHENLGRFQPPFYRLIESQALHNPLQIALRYQKQTLTYKELNVASNKFGHYLLAAGLENRIREHQEKNKETVVAIYLNPGLLSEIVLFAVMKTGAAFMLLDADAQRFSVKSCYERINQAEPCFLITEESLKNALLKEESLLTHNEEKIDWHQTKMIDAKMIFESGFLSRSHAFGTLSENNLDRPILTTDLSYVVFTSGSTGVPKGIKVPNTMVFPFAAHQNYLNSGRGTKIAKIASDNFDASLMERAIALGAGAELCLFDKETLENFELFAQAMNERKVDVAIFTPNHLRELNPTDFPFLKTLLIVGDAYETALPKKWHDSGKFVINGWGMNETTVCGGLGPFKPGLPLNVDPIFGFHFYLCPEESDEAQKEREKENHDQPLIKKPGEEGILWVAGAPLFLGYLKQPDLSAKNFSTKKINGKKIQLFCTGDRVSISEEGHHFEIKGRTTGIVKINGQRIELSEVEALLKEDPRVEDVRILLRSLGKENKEQKKYLSAYIVPKEKSLVFIDGKERSLESMHEMREIQLQLASKAFAYKVPALINMYFVDTLPRKNNDKKSYNDAEIILRTPRSGLPPSKTMEQYLKTMPGVYGTLVEKVRLLAAEILDLEASQVWVSVSLIDFGFDSLQIRRFLSKLKRIFSDNEKIHLSAKDLTVDQILKNPTIEGIASTLMKGFIHKKSDDFERKALLDTLKKSSVEWRLLSEYNLYNNRFLGESPIVCVGLPSLSGSAELDYQGTVLESLPIHLLFPKMPALSLSLMSPEETMKRVSEAIVQQICADAGKQRIIFLAAWSSAYILAEPVGMLLREKGYHVSHMILDSTHPKILQQKNNKDHAVVLVNLGTPLKQLILKQFFPGKDLDFELPAVTRLAQIQDKQMQVKYFFGEMREKLKTLERSTSPISAAPSQCEEAKTLLLWAEFYVLWEMTRQWDNNIFAFGGKDLLVAAESSVKQEGDDLGWMVQKNDKNVFHVIEKTDHFSLLQSKDLQETIIRFFVSQLKSILLPLPAPLLANTVHDQEVLGSPQKRRKMVAQVPEMDDEARVQPVPSVPDLQRIEDEDVSDVSSQNF